MARTSRVRRTAVVLAATTPLVAAALVGSASTPALAGGGKVAGLGTNDFAFLNALKIQGTNVAQVSVAQTAAGVGRPVDTTDSLGQKLLDKSSSGKNAYGHGAGVSLNLGQGANTTPQVRLVQAEAVSPRPSFDKTSLLDLSNTPLEPVVSAVVQPDTAVANTQGPNYYCVIGAPISGGTSHVADASLINVPGFNLLHADAAVNTASTESLAPNGHSTFGLQTDSVIEPVGITLFKGVSPLTIKILNPLVLRATAGGFPGTAKVEYGADGKGSIPVVSITNGGQTETLTMDQLIGHQGITLHLGVADVEVGVPPKISTSANGTKASASSDLVKITVPGDATNLGASIGGPLGDALDQVLNPVISGLQPVLSQIQDALKQAGLQVVDLRIGHQESSAQVPVGGIDCPIPVTKTANPNPVQAGNDFVYTITATNTICVGGLEHVKVEDSIDADPGISWTVKSTNPQADKVTNTHVTWNDIGTIPYGKSSSVTITVHVDGGSEGGLFHDHAHVTGKCGTGGANGQTQVVNLTGNTTVNTPKVTPREQLPHTGLAERWTVAGLLLLVAGTAGAALRRRLA